jgi:hypothetical protein
VSDIHFDPFYDGSLFEELQARPADQKADVLERTQPVGFNPGGTDCNFALLKSSLDDARKRVPQPDFILYPGDLLAHQWQPRYDALARKSHLDDPVAYQSFTAKAVYFLAGEFRRRFPSVVVVPTLGNEDSYCGDYKIEPEGPFLTMFADTWAPLLGSNLDLAAFQKTFAHGGYFTMGLPRMPRQRIIVLNSVFFSTNYDNACGKGPQTPALDEFGWLADTLAQALAAGESVWLLMHVPPGINSYNSVGSVAQGGAPATFWQQELTSRFLQIVRDRGSIMHTSFAGHTHMDDFRIVRGGGNVSLLVKITPAISPIYGNNPGYQVYQYDRESGALLNYQTYYLTNLASGGKPTLPTAASWALEYDFRQAYGCPALSAESVARLANQMLTDGSLQQKYTSYYAVSAPPEFTPQAFSTYRCAIASVTPADFLMCVSGVLKPKRPAAFPDRAPRLRTATAR